jgi:hypothetical protein
MEPRGRSSVEVDRYYHGTSSDFARPDSRKFSPVGQYGEGYYLTDNPRVASSYGEGAEDSASAIQQELDGLLARKGRRLSDRQANVVDQRIADLQQQLAEMNPSAGPNVRVVHVPRNLNLFDLDASALLSSADFGKVLTRNQMADFSDNISQMLELPKNANGLTNKDVYAALSDAMAGSKARANKVLAKMGYDGLRYQGGNRMAGNGQALRHNALVIFAESLDKLTNATAGAPHVPARHTFPASH